MLPVVMRQYLVLSGDMAFDVIWYHLVLADGICWYLMISGSKWCYSVLSVLVQPGVINYHHHRPQAAQGWQG